MEYPSLPARRQGKHHDTVSMCCLDTAEEAEVFYRLVLDRLQAVNDWYNLSADIKAAFTLCDAQGKRLTRSPQVGDYIKIDLPGPGHPDGQGYDWVRIVEVQESTQEPSFFTFTVQPSENPTSASSDTVHFFQPSASNTFVVRKVGSCILAEVHGRNEESNTSEGSLLGRVRNQLIAVGGKLGLSKIQWQALTAALVRREEEGD